VIFIVVKFPVLPDRSEEWPLVHHCHPRGPGNICFEWSRSVDDPNQFVLLEARRG
jgi:quinol monooxygenase YgiN